MTEKEIRAKLKDIKLSQGESAVDYVMSLPDKHKEVATEAILNCLQKGYPLNNLEITREGRAINRKKMRGIES